jgi:hypothetical protein
MAGIEFGSSSSSSSRLKAEKGIAMVSSNYDCRTCVWLRLSNLVGEPGCAAGDTACI